MTSGRVPPVRGRDVPKKKTTTNRGGDARKHTGAHRHAHTRHTAERRSGAKKTHEAGGTIHSPAHSDNELDNEGYRDHHDRHNRWYKRSCKDVTTTTDNDTHTRIHVYNISAHTHTRDDGGRDIYTYRDIYRRERRIKRAVGVVAVVVLVVDCCESQKH